MTFGTGGPCANEYRVLGVNEDVPFIDELK